MAAHLQVPDRRYVPSLDLRETEIAIKFIKDHFEQALSAALHLTRVSAPLFVRPESGLNDNLNGIERPVAFDYAAHRRQFSGNRAVAREVEAHGAWPLRLPSGGRPSIQT